jgi:Ca-activated chloride channel homolog
LSFELSPMSNWTLHDPWWLLALFALGAMAWLRHRRSTPVLVVPFAAAWQHGGAAPKTSWPAVFAYLAIVLLIGALARPQIVDQKRETKQQGYDIVLVIDLSTSMYAEDFERDGRPINRLQALKPVIEAFINRRANDRIGVVVFAGRAYTLAPLTFDHTWLREQVSRLRIGLIEGTTAIGDAFGVALTRLEQGRKELGRLRDGAFVVLLTDGKNEAGELDPRDALKLAVERGITVHTIGAGREGWVRVPVFDPETGRRLGTDMRPSDLDEALLRDIASKTNGLFFRVDDTRAVDEAFAAIDRAQKVEFQSTAYVVTEEVFPWLALPGLILLAIAALGAAYQSHREALA